MAIVAFIPKSSVDKVNLTVVFTADIFKLVFYFIMHSMHDWLIICPLSEVVVHPCLWSLLVFVRCFLVYLVTFDLCTAQSYLKFY